MRSLEIEVGPALAPHIRVSTAEISPLYKQPNENENPNLLVCLRKERTKEALITQPRLRHGEGKLSLPKSLKLQRSKCEREHSAVRGKSLALFRVLSLSHSL